MPDWSNPLELVKDAGKFASLCLRHIPDTRMLRDCLHRLSCSLKSHHWAAWLSLIQFRDTREAHAGGVRVVHLGNNRPAPIDWSIISRKVHWALSSILFIKLNQSGDVPYIL